MNVGRRASGVWGIGLGRRGHGGSNLAAPCQKVRKTRSLSGGLSSTFIGREGTISSFACMADKTPYQLGDGIEKCTKRGRLGRG